jgi:hypothetical protein
MGEPGQVGTAQHFGSIISTLIGLTSSLPVAEESPATTVTTFAPWVPIQKKLIIFLKLFLSNNFF